MWFVLYESYSFCIPSFIFMIEWICTNANNIHLNAASVKSPLFTKPAFETKLILPCYCQFYEFFGICVTKNPIFNGYFYREHRFYHFNIPFVRKLVVDFTDSKNRILIEQVWMPEINRSAEPNFDGLWEVDQLKSFQPHTVTYQEYHSQSHDRTSPFWLIHRTVTIVDFGDPKWIGYLKFQFCICVWVGSSVSWVNNSLISDSKEQSSLGNIRSYSWSDQVDETVL